MAETTPSNWCPVPETPRPVQDVRQLIGNEPRGSHCHLGMRPRLIEGSLIRLLQAHYANPSNIEDPFLKTAAIWRPGTPSGILIESVYRWRPDLTELRPALLVKRQAYRNMRILLADRIGSDEQGNDQLLTLWVGSHTLFCIHGTGAGADDLATETQREVTQFANVVAKFLGLLKFLVTEVGEVSEVYESNQHYVVPITVGWAYREVWTVAPDALPLKAVSVNIRNVCTVNAA